MLSYALHRYRTYVRTSTRATPNSLVYGMEVVLPIEVEILSLRVLAEVELEEAEWLYQRKIKNAFNKKARPPVFKEGDMVLKKILPNVKDQRGKWAPNYEGPYIVKHAFSRRALILTDAERRDLRHPVNADSVKMFFP
ncbi:hypothetical protein CR513_47447, partial [Mucuna pruriens]